MHVVLKADISSLNILFVSFWQYQFHLCIFQHMSYHFKLVFTTLCQAFYQTSNVKFCTGKHGNCLHSFVIYESPQGATRNCIFYVQQTVHCKQVESRWLRTVLRPAILLPFTHASKVIMLVTKRIAPHLHRKMCQIINWLHKYSIHWSDEMWNNSCRN
jgi:hypothetical protein